MAVTRHEVVMHFSTDGTLTDWRVDELDNNDKTVGQKNKAEVLAGGNIANYSAHLHPLLRAMKYSLKPPLELLYFLQSKIAKKELAVGIRFSHADIRIFVLPAGKSAARQVSIDDLIAMVRKKNKTHVHMDEIIENITHITSRFPDSSHTPQKMATLTHFAHFYMQKKEQIFSRAELVEAWVKACLQQNNPNPFEVLSRQRGKNSLFNPKETDSIVFFKKFLRGESVSDFLSDALDVKPVRIFERAYEGAATFQPKGN